MRLPPPEVVATWPPPNYINPVTRGPTLIIVELITLAVSLICLGLRLYVRIKLFGRIGLDDWLMMGGAIFGAGVTICVLLAFIQYGWDIHIWDLTLDKVIAGRQVSFAAQALFVPATSLAKVSILVSYLRLAPMKSCFRRLTIAAIWYVVLLNIAFFVVLFAQCIPLSSYWNLLRNNRDCIPEAPALLSQASTTASSDFIVWILPLPFLYRAKLPLSQRLGVLALFSFAGLVVSAACIRTYWVYYVVEETYDVTWYGFHLWMWTAVEVQLGIVCGCVPWLRSLVNYWRRDKTVIELADPSGAPKRSPPEDGRQPTTTTRMDSLRRGLSGETVREWEGDRDKDNTWDRDRRREKYADLESGTHTWTNPDPIPPFLPDTTPGLAL